MLASFVIEDIKRFCKNTAPDGTAWAYYYCYFRREQNEVPHLLRWIINQLCRQLGKIPNELMDLYIDGEQPTTANLTLALSTVLLYFHRVHLVVDALDESLDQRYLLDLLVHIAKDESFSKIKLIVTSRKELDIQRALESVSMSISLSNPRVDQDLRVYVQGQLRGDRKLSRWPASLRAVIEDTLVEGAQGICRQPRGHYHYNPLDHVRSLLH